MSDKRLLDGFNQCGLINGYESITDYKHALLPELAVYETTTQYRLLIPSICAMTIDRDTLTIEHAYTAPQYRRQGYGKGLLMVARSLFGIVKHSEYLTNDGKKFAK